MSFDVVVVGGGFAGAGLVVRLAQSGAKVAWSRGPAGGSAFWSGMAHLYGPVASQPAPGAHPQPYMHKAPLDELMLPPEQRMKQLKFSAPDHPYARVQATAGEVGEAAKRLASALDLPLRFGAEADAWVSYDGTIRYADGAAATMPPARELAGATVVQLAEAPRFSASWVASALTRATGVASVAAVPEPVEPPAVSLGAALQLWMSRDLHARADALAGILSKFETRESNLALLPFLPARSFDEASALTQLVKERCGFEIAEVTATSESIIGVRAFTHLRALKLGGVEVMGSVSSAPHFVEGQWSVQLGSTEVKAKAVVLATGDAVGQGALSDWLDAFRDPADAPSVLPPTPWERMPSLGRRLWTDESMQVEHRGQILKGLYAVGSLIAGHDVALDQSAFGVSALSVERTFRALEGR